MSAPIGTLEREHELDRIAAALEAAAAGNGRAIIIEGPAGIGKTRLVQDTRALAKLRGFGRLQATGDELESAMAWSVVRQLVERSISRYRGEDRARLLAGPSGAALEVLDRAPSEAPAGDAAVARTLHALWWVAADLASFRPLLITIDDAQWADLPSLRFLAYLSRRIADLPIALVVATRPPHQHSGPLAELSAGRGEERILPRPLSRDGVAAMSTRGGVEPAAEVVAAVHAASGGNPFLAGLLVDELDAKALRLDAAGSAGAVAHLGPAAISRALLARLAPEAIALAGAAAVLGARSDPRLAAVLADMPDARVADARDALVAGHVLTGDPEQLVFAHPVVREAVLGHLGPGERTTLHAKAAQTLHAAGAPLARVAAHLAFAPTGTLPEAAVLLRAAAARLLADGDAATAAAHLTRALQETPRDQELSAELGFAQFRAGDPAAARELLRAAAEVAPTLRERAERLSVAASATGQLDGLGAGIAELRAVLDGWPESGAEPARLVLEARLATICSLLPEESQRSAARLQQFADLPGETREERAVLALLAQRARYDVRPAREVAALAEHALGAGAYLADMADGAEWMVGWIAAVMALISADAIEPAAAEIERARTWLRRQGSPLEFGIVSGVAGWLAWRTGDVTGAEAETAASMAAVAAEDPTPTMVAVSATATHFMVYAQLERGDLAAAADALAAVEALCAGAPRIVPVTRLGDPRAHLALATGDPARARRAALTVGDELRVAQLDTIAIPWRVPAALAALRLGDDEEARALAGEQLELARRWGTATETGSALRLVARVEPERRIDLLEEAIALLEESPARLELARALVDLGEALRVARRRSAARDPLRRGADVAAACGSRILRQRALDGLASLGDRPRKLMFSGQESLTASERRVAQLASDGRTNRDIAQELFVTPKTVENHLARAYAKLGISSRRELAAGLS